MKTQGQPFRVVTYNVALGKALERERKTGAPGIRAAFDQEGRLRHADVLGVQEVAGHEQGWQLDYFKALVAGPGQAPTTSAFGLSDPVGPGYGDCQRGEALFARHAMLDSGVIQLPDLKEPRSAIWADLDVGGRPVRVYNVHLENLPRGGARGRLQQMEVVVAHLRAWTSAHPTAPVFVLGDLNTIFAREPCLKLLSEDLTACHTGKPATHWMRQTLDWVFSRNARLLGSHVVKMRYSDHYPVVADYWLE